MNILDLNNLLHTRTHIHELNHQIQSFKSLSSEQRNLNSIIFESEFLEAFISIQLDSNLQPNVAF